MYRSLVARLMYMSQDRSDCRYAVKELARKMSKPVWGDRRKLKRVARYLVDKVRAVIAYKYQLEVELLEVWSDTDFA